MGYRPGRSAVSVGAAAEVAGVLLHRLAALLGVGVRRHLGDAIEWAHAGLGQRAGDAAGRIGSDLDAAERRIEVEWDSAGTDQAPYVVRLTMQVEDRKGMLAEISAKISDINTNITNMEARTGEDQQARIDMTVEIRDVKHLEKVIKSIKGVQGVLGVERTARA